MISMQPQPAGLPSGTIGGRRSGRTAAWQWRRLLSSPHRLAFWGACLVLALGSLWWGATLALAAAGHNLPWAVPAPLARATVMGLGLAPLFVLGMLHTLGSGWLGMGPVPGRLMLAPVLALLGGWLMAVVGSHLSAPLAALGLAAAAVGLALGTGLFGLMVMESRVANRDHAVLALLGCAVVVVAQWAVAVMLALRLHGVAWAVLQAACWGGIGLAMLAVGHRLMKPLAASDELLPAVWRSRQVLAAMAAMLVCQAVLVLGEGLVGGSVSALPAALRAALELPTGAWLLALALRWGWRQRAGARLFGLLCLGLAWLGVAFTLSGVSHALMSSSGGALSLGDAPLQALLMGFVGSMLLASATATVRALSGRAVLADNWVWLMAWALQVAALAQVCAALWPQAATPLQLLAAQFWLGSMGAWVLRHLAWLGQPRVDGAPN